MIFIETSAFTRYLPDYLSDEDYQALQSYLMQKPDAGAIVRGSGGYQKSSLGSRWKGEKWWSPRHLLLEETGSRNLDVNDLQ
jgi:hypothetical protein